MLGCLELFVLTFMLLQDCSQSLRLVEVRIPNYVIKGSTAQLECIYDLDGEALYSVKWYKDGNEFYRYVPRDMPPAQTFLLPGVSVDVHNSRDAIITLREVNLQSSGRFRCEVSGEAPSFQTVTEHGDMVVVSLPDQGPPKIIGGRPRYQIGDWVRINCTAGRSKPAVQLYWFINGEAAEPHTLRKYDTIISGREGLETSVLGLQFRVEQHHFRNGDMKLKCVASLSTFYWRSNEESVEGDRPQKAPVLESRETAYASNSRADAVQGMSWRESFVTNILQFFIQPNAANKTDSTLNIKPSTIIFLIAMALITTTTGCLEEFYLNDVLRVLRQQSRTHYNNTNNDLFKHEGYDKVNDKKLKQNEDKEQKLQKGQHNKLVFHFNREISSRLPIILIATKRTEEFKTKVISIFAKKQVNQTSKNFISLQQPTTSSSNLPLRARSPSCLCCPFVTSIKHSVKSPNLR